MMMTFSCIYQHKNILADESALHGSLAAAEPVTATATRVDTCQLLLVKEEKGSKKADPMMIRQCSSTIRSAWPIVVGCLFLFAISTCNASTSGSVSASSASSSRGKSSLGMQPSPFVAAAPLIAAAVCRDGVVIVAAHASAQDEPLLYHTYKDNTETNENKDETITNGAITTTASVLGTDLPRDFKGPFRIQAIDAYGTTLVCAGWRSDCDILTARCRALAASETSRMGQQQQPSSCAGNVYGHYLATELSLYMSHCAVSERMRALSCVGLLIVPGTANSIRARLWLVDATGMYPVRAHCIGGGVLGKTAEAVAGKLNAQLGRVDFDTLDARQGAKRLLELLAGETVEQQGGQEINDPVSLLKEGVCLEVATVENGKRRMSRLPVASLLREANDESAQ